MTNWRYTCDIKQHFMYGDFTEKDFPKCRDAIVAELKTARDFSTDYELEEIVEWLEDAPDLDEFNAVLSNLYDWADDNLVWMGSLMARSSYIYVVTEGSYQIAGFTVKHELFGWLDVTSDPK